MLPHEYLQSFVELLQTEARQFARISNLFLREWILGPHGPKENRGFLGKLGLFVIESRLWERIFLVFILLNTILKLTWSRDMSCSYADFLNIFNLWACLIFTFELVCGMMVYGIAGFFSQKWYIADAVATFFSWTSYAVTNGILPGFFSFIFPNISFVRMLRFLKPFGRIKALIDSKIVVKTVADAISSMFPVLSLVFFCTLLFAIVGINLFGRRGVLRYTCGLPLSLVEADSLLSEEAQSVLNFRNCSVNMYYYTQFLETQDAQPGALRDLTVNGSEMTCVATTPSTYCRCEKNSNDNFPLVCVDLYNMCNSSLCFRGDQYVGSSPLHTFENFIFSALSVIAFLYLKDWTEYFAACNACVGAAYAYIYFLLLVIFGSFCLLNLTVATVSDVYSKVKKLTNAKQKRLDEERLETERQEAERKEMKERAGRHDDAATAAPPLLFDTALAYKYWAIGAVVLFPCLHRFYLKDWRCPGLRWWLLLRVATLNYGMLGWVLDGLSIGSLNEEASRLEQERIDSTFDALCNEQDRIRAQLATPGMTRNIIWALSYPLDTTPADWTIAYLQGQIDAVKSRMVTPAKNETDGGSHSDELSTTSADGGNQQQEPRQRWSQSFFAWQSDLVVVANAASMAMLGFGQNLNPIITAVGYFATVYFAVESVLKCIAYCGFQYYIADQPNRLDFFLVIVPTCGELVCQTTKSLAATNYREDYIYPMLVLRALRVLRILKLTKHMKGLKLLAQRAFGSPAGVIYAFLVTICFILLLALFGSQLFRSSITFAENRDDFEYILGAMKALIEFLFGDHYFDNIDAGFESANFVGVLFFVTYYYIGNFVVLRIFIAIILENFEYVEEKKICLQIQLYQRYQILSNDLINGE